MDTKDKKLTSIRLNKSLYKHLQKRAKEENRSVNNYIETLLYDASEYRIPNEETLAAMKEMQDYDEGKIELDTIESKEELQEYFKRLLEETDS
ncbi:MAG: hypothetical protein WCY63_11700 [Weeksellaceae bacterium]